MAWAGSSLSSSQTSLRDLVGGDYCIVAAEQAREEALYRYAASNNRIFKLLSKTEEEEED